MQAHIHKHTHMVSLIADCENTTLVEYLAWIPSSCRFELADDSWFLFDCIKCIKIGLKINSYTTMLRALLQQLRTSVMLMCRIRTDFWQKKIKRIQQLFDFRQQYEKESESYALATLRRELTLTIFSWESDLALLSSAHFESLFTQLVHLRSHWLSVHLFIYSLFSIFSLSIFAQSVSKIDQFGESNVK